MFKCRTLNVLTFLHSQIKRLLLSMLLDVVEHFNVDKRGTNRESLQRQRSSDICGLYLFGLYITGHRRFILKKNFVDNARSLNQYLPTSLRKIFGFLGCLCDA